MGKRMTIAQAASTTGLSEYFLRKGIKEGRLPHIRTGLGTGKFWIDVELLERYLEQEAMDNTKVHESRSVINYGQLRRVPQW